MRAQPKRLGNQIITGSMLAALATAYVDAINHGAVPTIATAWQVVIFPLANFDMTQMVFALHCWLCQAFPKFLLKTDGAEKCFE